MQREIALLKEKIMIWSHSIKNDLANNKLLGNENGVNESRNWSLGLGMISRKVERISEKHGDNPC